MCTLILGCGVLGAGSLIVAANRDEDPARTSEPPLLLSERPNVVGGRDLRSGGTWLAIRDGRAVVALLNRHGTSPEGETRSRGLLVLDVAKVEAEGEAFAAAALDEARASIDEHAYAPFTLVCAGPSGGWVLAHDGVAAHERQALTPGWHVLTHAELDDPAEPRAVRLMSRLTGFTPGSIAEAETKLLEILTLHGSFGDGAPPEPGSAEATQPPAAAAVCIHDGRMVTVSTSLFRIARGGSRYIHIEGRPCTTPPQDLSALIAT